MKTERAVVATNDVITLPNGVRECIADEALEDMALQITASGGRPSLVEHDWSRPRGWASRAKTEREGQRLKLVVECDVPETESELEIVRRRISNYWGREVAQRVEPFREFANSLGVSGISLNADLDCVLLQSPGILSKLCQHFLKNMDVDGLVPVRDRKSVV